MRTIRFADGGSSDVDRLLNAGADVLHAAHVLVRREPQSLRTWLADRARRASSDLDPAPRALFFFSVLPVLIATTILGGLEIAAALAAVVAAGAIAIALRGRSGAVEAFPLRACFLAPLSVFERSVSVYLALGMVLRGQEAAGSPAPPARTGSSRAASGE
jgi:hypothetical protein